MEGRNPVNKREDGDKRQKEFERSQLAAFHLYFRSMLLRQAHALLCLEHLLAAVSVGITTLASLTHNPVPGGSSWLRRIVKIISAASHSALCCQTFFASIFLRQIGLIPLI